MQPSILLGDDFWDILFERKTKVALTIQVQAGHFGLSKVELKEDDQPPHLSPKVVPTEESKLIFFGVMLSEPNEING